MESQPQNPEFRNNPANFHPCKTIIGISANNGPICIGFEANEQEKLQKQDFRTKIWFKSCCQPNCCGNLYHLCVNNLLEMF